MVSARLKRFEKYFTVPYGVLFGVLLLTALYLHTHGFPTADEGWILQASKRLVDGDVVYQDFQFIYHPGILYLNALAYQILGTSVLTSRIVALANTLTSLFLLFYISKKNKFSFVLTSLVMAGFLFWGAGHINFSWPVMFCITCALACAAVWTAWFERKKNNYIVAVGVFSALTVLFKQNFGLAIFLINLLSIAFFTEKSRFKVFERFLFGFFLVIAFQFVYFWSNGSFGWYLSDMKYLLIERIFLQGVLNSELPWHYPGPIHYRILKVGLYNLPLLASLIALFIAWKNKNKSIIYYSLITVSYYVLSIRPTTDYIHLAPLISLACLPIAYIVQTFQNKWFKWGAIALMSLLVLAGAYSAIFKNYYRWDVPLIEQNIFASHPRMLVSIDKKSQENVEAITSFFSARQQEEYVFVYSFSPQFNLILNKKNPTRYDYLHTGVLNPEIEQEVITDVASKNVQFILTDVNVELEKDSIAAFIRANYHPVITSGKYVIWQRNTVQ